MPSSQNIKEPLKNISDALDRNRIPERYCEDIRKIIDFCREHIKVLELPRDSTLIQEVIRLCEGTPINRLTLDELGRKMAEALLRLDFKTKFAQGKKTRNKRK